MGKNPIELLAVVYEGVETCHSETTGGGRDARIKHRTVAEWNLGISQLMNSDPKPGGQGGSAQDGG